MEIKSKYNIGDKIYFLCSEEKDKTQIVGNVYIRDGIINHIFADHFEREDWGRAYDSDDINMIQITNVRYRVDSFASIDVEERYCSSSINELLEMLFKRSNKNQRYKLEE